MSKISGKYSWFPLVVTKAKQVYFKFKSTSKRRSFTKYKVFRDILVKNLTGKKAFA